MQQIFKQCVMEQLLENIKKHLNFVSVQYILQWYFNKYVNFSFYIGVGSIVDRTCLHVLLHYALGSLILGLQVQIHDGIN